MSSRDTTSSEEAPHKLTEEEIKAAARAYALSDTSTKKKKKNNKRNQLLTAKRMTPLPIAPKIVSHPYLDFIKTGGTMVAKSVDELDEYGQFVKSLTVDDAIQALLRDEDDEEEYQDVAEEDEDDEEDVDERDEDRENHTNEHENSNAYENNLDLPDFDEGFMKELEEELGWLEEEDMEAAVATLLDQPTRNEHAETTFPNDAFEEDASASTPLRDAARAPRIAVTSNQYEQLQSLLNTHYQLLMQQAVLSVRAAHMQKVLQKRERVNSGDYVPGGESSDDLVEVLDGAIGMLQDLDQNRKDAIRHFIQFETKNNARRALFSEPDERRLTRAQFNKTLLEQSNGRFRTVFDIPGLNKLNETFDLLDKSVESSKSEQKSPSRVRTNVLQLGSNSVACQVVLDKADAKYEKTLVPGIRDTSANFLDPKEFMGPKFKPPCTHQQSLAIKRNRSLFTNGEDNLVLRGVNLYGEKQWELIANRFLPDRSCNIIAQRYSSLCVMVYKANGVSIDGDGNLETPPKFESIDDVDFGKVKLFKKVEPPAILNVHRWSYEEDLTILKAVPVMGNMWAELKARLLPHRDRGHIRKRYQVLERRIKGTVQRANKAEPIKVPKQNVPIPYHVHASCYAKSNDPYTQMTMPAIKSTSEPNFGKSSDPASKSISTVKYPPYGNTSSGHYPPLAPGPMSKTTSYPFYPGNSQSSATYPPRPKGDQLTEENSRLMFEKLVQETSDDWSQMSRVKEMIKDGNENEVANAIVEKLAKSPGKRPHSNIAPDFKWQDPFIEHQEDVTTRDAVGFLAEVLERSRDSGNLKRKVPESRPSANEASSQRKKVSIAEERLDTPARKPGRFFYSTSGTPIGVSPSFHTRAVLNGSVSLASPNMGSIIHKDLGEGMSNMLHGSPPGRTMDGFDFQSDFAETHGTPSPPKASNAPLLLDGSTLMENDLEAASALNSLSTSPAQSLFGKRGELVSSQESSEEDHAKQPRKSLFAQVVGGAQKPSANKKRKLF